MLIAIINILICYQRRFVVDYGQRCDQPLVQELTSWYAETVGCHILPLVKSGLNILTVEWTRMLKNDGVKVWAIARGLLATNLGGDPDFLKRLGAKDHKVGGEAIRGVIEGKRDADVGKVVREYQTPIQPW